MPKVKRPPDRWSSVATSFAVMTGSRWATRQMPVPKRTRSVTAAMVAMATKGSTVRRYSSGSGSPMGAGVARLTGMWVCSGSHTAENPRSSAARASATGVIERAEAYQASVDSWDDDVRMVEQVVAHFGYVDLLVNNGGIASRGHTVADTDPAELERVVRTHAIGPHFLTKLVLPSMRQRPRGDVVMISSVATSHMGAGGAPYNMGKAALEALAFTLAKEERRHGIHVNVVAPGLVVTEMGHRLVRARAGVHDATELDASSPFGRVCRPEDVANVVRYLVSDAAGYLTGQRIAVDGGG